MLLLLPNRDREHCAVRTPLNHRDAGPGDAHDRRQSQDVYKILHHFRAPGDSQPGHPDRRCHHKTNTDSFVTEFTSLALRA